MKKTTTCTILTCALFAGVLQAGNVKPEVVVQSASMRPGTTYMDINFRVNDPDDDMVKVRALAFIDGIRSFEKVLRLQTLVEGTEILLGDEVSANTDHTLTWNVGADWSIDLGQLKIEIMARDQRGLLTFDWVTIPETSENEEITISLNAPTEAEVWDALFWMYADDDPWLQLQEGGVLVATEESGTFWGQRLVFGGEMKTYAAPLVIKKMNLAVSDQVSWAANVARAGIIDIDGWHAEKKPYDGLTCIYMTGINVENQNATAGVGSIVAGNGFNLALREDGTVFIWGLDLLGRMNMPTGLNNVVAIAAGWDRGLVLISNGTVIGWGNNNVVPAGLNNVVAIGAAVQFSLALKSDGTVVGWGNNISGGLNFPADLNNVVAISAGNHFSLMLMGDGTIVGWGDNSRGQLNVPSWVNDVKAIAAGDFHCLALKNDGTVVGWGDNSQGQISIPADLTDVIEIAAGDSFSLALKSDGTVVGWGRNVEGQINIPTGLRNVKAISAGAHHALMLTSKVN